MVGKFVEFYGTGLSALSLADRATVANMAPEYGATMGFFPVDQETLSYLKFSNRDPELIALVEAYTKEQGLFRTDSTPDPVYADTLELDLAAVTPSMAGPKRPQDRVELPDVKKNFHDAFPGPPKTAVAQLNGASATIGNGAVVIAAITSCTNTSNPSVMLAAGLLAKKAVERGLTVKPWVKTSLAPGSKVVADYYRKAGLTPYLEKLNFHLVGFGCTTCIGNSGPLPEPVAQAVQKENLVVAAVLERQSQFRRPHQSAGEGQLSGLAAAGGGVRARRHHGYRPGARSAGHGSDGQPVYLRDIWPSNEEVQNTVRASIDQEMFRHEYAKAFDGDANWQGMSIPTGSIYQWDDESTYIKKPPYFDHMVDPETSVTDLKGMRVLALLGDSVTTDHISPAGSIAKDSPAGRYLISQGRASQSDFNSYGARRGNHEVMVRGTLANIRLRNQTGSGDRGQLDAAHARRRADVHLRRLAAV